MSGLLDRLSSWWAPREERAVTMKSLHIDSTLGSAGVAVNTSTAQQVAAVSAAIDVISSMTASLPILIYRIEGDGKVELIDDAAARLLEAPNDWMTRADVVAWLMRQALLYGNGLVEIVRDDAGAPAALIPCPWPTVTPLLLNARRLAFDVVETGGSQGGMGPRRRLLSGEYMHLRDHSDDGFIGVPRIGRCSSAIAVALAAQEHAASWFGNGAHPSGVLKVAAKLGPSSLELLKQNLKDGFVGPAKSSRVLVLDQGSEFEPVPGTPEQSELVETRRFSVEEIARIFGVPLIFLQSLQNVNYAAARHAFELLAVQSLAPWCTKLEALLTRSLFSAERRLTHKVEIDLSGLTRGDFGARWTAWKIARETGVLSADEIREAEGYSPGAPAEGGNG